MGSSIKQHKVNLFVNELSSATATRALGHSSDLNKLQTRREAPEGQPRQREKANSVNAAFSQHIYERKCFSVETTRKNINFMYTWAVLWAENEKKKSRHMKTRGKQAKAGHEKIENTERAVGLRKQIGKVLIKYLIWRFQKILVCCFRLERCDLAANLFLSRGKITFGGVLASMPSGFWESTRYDVIKWTSNQVQTSPLKCWEAIQSRSFCSINFQSHKCLPMHR